jgi:hypothetical protein
MADRPALMYEELAGWFHLVTPPEEYADEAERYRRLLVEACDDLEWIRDPDPADTTYEVDYAYLLREGPRMRALHDRHECGVFPRATWRRLLGQAGLTDVSEPGAAMFLARKPR